MADIDKAFREVPRANFLPEDVKDQASLDVPLPIGFEQTNSQPTTVRMMLQWLDPRPGEKILDIGSGSGWTTALLGYLVGPRGKVDAVERISELVAFGRQNCHRLGLDNVDFYQSGKEYGLPKHAPYDGILVSAAARSLPRELVEQLRIGGRMVIPVLSSIFVINKTSEQSFTTKQYPGFAFVPLV